MTLHIKRTPKKLTAFFLISWVATASLFAQQQSAAEQDSTDIYDRVILNRITIVGKPAWQTSIPGAANYIDTATLQQQEYTDIHRVLRLVSGVNVQEEDGFGLRPNIGMRGTGVSRSSKITVMEDGILMAPAPYASPAAYYFPNISRMNSVEIRKGSSQIKYGPNTTGGAINLISTPIPHELSGQLSVSAGGHSTRKLHAHIGNSWKNFGFLVEAYQMQNDGFKSLDFGGNTGFDIKDFLGKIMFRTNPEAPIYQRLEFKIGYYDERSDETYLGLTQADFDNSPFRRYAASQMDRMDADQLQLSARHFAQFSEYVDLTTTLYRNEFNRNWYKLQSVQGHGIAAILDNPDEYNVQYDLLLGESSTAEDFAVRANNREYSATGIQSILGARWDLGSIENSAEAGIRYHVDEMDRFQWDDDYRMEDGRMILSNEGIHGSESNRIESASSLAFFVQNEMRGDRWSLTPGFRYERIELERENFGADDYDRAGTDIDVRSNEINVFVPGVGATFDVIDGVTLLAGVHRGFSPPSPGSSAETDAEKSTNYEFGARVTSGSITAEVVGFFNDYTNLLGSDLAAGGGSGTNRQFNGGEVEVIGLEASYTMDLNDLFNLPSLQLPLSLNYTFTEATFQNHFESDFGPWGTVEKGFDLPYLPRHQLNFALGFQYEGFALNVNGFTVSDMRTQAGTGSIPANERIDGHLIFDGTASYQIHSYANLFVNVRNLTDNVYMVSRRPAGVRPGLPRTLMAGVKVML